MKKITVNYKGKKVDLVAKEMNLIDKFKGLMFRSRKCPPLLFSFSRERRVRMHSLFVFFNFLVLWADKNNNIVDCRIAKPFMFNISSDKKCSKIVEIPINSINFDVVRFFVGK